MIESAFLSTHLQTLVLFNFDFYSFDGQISSPAKIGRVLFVLKANLIPSPFQVRRHEPNLKEIFSIASINIVFFAGLHRENGFANGFDERNTVQASIVIRKVGRCKILPVC